MSKVLYILPLFLLAGCQALDNSQVETLLEEKHRLEDENKELNKLLAEQTLPIDELSRTIEGLKYPAEERSRQIDKLIDKNKFDEAFTEILALNQLFPDSPESRQTHTQEARMRMKISLQKAEQEKLETQGFRSLKENYKFPIDYLTVSVGKIKIGDQYVFDRYGKNFQYSTAEKGSKYITMPVTFTSKVDDPRLPQFAAYRIQGDKLIPQGRFHLRFSRWESMNTYSGNKPDNRNDFAKSPAIPFDLGLEVDTETAAQPLFILVKNENCLGRNTDMLRQPPVYYSGMCQLEKESTLEDLQKKYTLVTILNKSKL